MKCPFCRENDTEVYNTRSTRFQTQIWRRRRCLNCQQSFTTYEQPDLNFLKVLPATGRPRRYSRAKLFSSIYAAFLDIKAKDGTIDAVTDTVEAKILDTKKDALSAPEIAAIVLTTLKHFNTSAFLRYLSTHAELASSAQLKKELKKY
ncbi:MAG TPA: ATP cone domain-containing protein [Candidatus Saccharimonadales bacterium]|nr:ATP cone domain-containing protein [Candidatus Saccharimonadales bacterium]